MESTEVGWHLTIINPGVYDRDQDNFIYLQRGGKKKKNKRNKKKKKRAKVNNEEVSRTMLVTQR